MGPQILSGFGNLLTADIFFTAASHARASRFRMVLAIIPKEIQIKKMACRMSMRQIHQSSFVPQRQVILLSEIVELPRTCQKPSICVQAATQQYLAIMLRRHPPRLPSQNGAGALPAWLPGSFVHVVPHMRSMLHRSRQFEPTASHTADHAAHPRGSETSKQAHQ